jgi:hypothetical protein
MGKQAWTFSKYVSILMLFSMDVSDNHGGGRYKARAVDAFTVRGAVFPTSVLSFI